MHSSTPNSPVLTVDGINFLMDAEPFDMWGIRTASGTMNDALCQHLIDQLDDYLAHGVNALTVFYMGCRGGNYSPFTPDGKTVDPGHQERMERIIQACAARRMVVIVGIFYWHDPFGLQDSDAVLNAVRTVTKNLKPYRNVIINVCNEHNSPEHKAVKHIYEFGKPERIVDLVRVVHEVDPDRIAGGGGYDHDANPVIGRSAEVDVLLFDNGVAPTSDQLHERFQAEGVTGKPMVNVEILGGWTKRFPRGVFDEDVRKAYLREVDAAVAIDGLSVFFHNNPWCQHQTEPMRYDLGGQGTVDDPGIRWYFEYVRDI